MRSTRPGERGSWASYARAARLAARLSQVELARRIGVDRTSIGRWESGRYKPDRADQVVAFARATGVPVEEALAAAGFRPHLEPPATPTTSADPELQAILDAPVPARVKQRMIAYLEQLRQNDAQRRAEMIRLMIERETG